MVFNEVPNNRVISHTFFIVKLRERVAVCSLNERARKMDTRSLVGFGDDKGVAGVSAQAGKARQARMAEERLPFTVKIVHGDAELGKAVSIRHAAYARHVPAVAAMLDKAERYDREEGSVVLLAESKMDGSPLGTMRIQTNRYSKLALEQSVDLPDWLQGCSLAEATRLGISEGRVGRIVKIVLFKAYFEYCLAAGIEWMVIAARSPLDRQYESLLFRDVLPEGGFMPMRHAGNIPHRVLAFEVGSAEERWAAANHPLLNFMRRTHHPDIDLGEENHPLLADAIGPEGAPKYISGTQVL